MLERFEILVKEREDKERRVGEEVGRGKRKRALGNPEIGESSDTASTTTKLLTRPHNCLLLGLFGLRMDDGSQKSRNTGVSK